MKCGTDSERTTKEELLVEEDDGQSSLTDHEIDVEDLDESDVGLHSPAKSCSSAIHHRHRRSFKEEEDEVENEEEEEEVLDKEEEEEPAVKSKKKSGKKCGKSSGSGGSGSSSSSSSNPQIKPKCNCDQLRLVDCHLETKELWDKFNELGTEMIITKTGRSVVLQILLSHPQCPIVMGKKTNGSIGSTLINKKKVVWRHLFPPKWNRSEGGSNYIPATLRCYLRWLVFILVDGGGHSSRPIHENKKVETGEERAEGIRGPSASRSVAAAMIYIW